MPKTTPVAQTISCDPRMTFEEFRDGIVLRNYKKVESKDKYYTDAVYDDQVYPQRKTNDDKETSFHDEGAMNPYEVYNSKPFLCTSGASPCDKSFAGPTGNQFKSTGTWLTACPVFHS